MSDISITRTTAPKTPPSDDSLTFGNVFTDHMFLMNYEDGKGWHDPRIVPYGPFTLDPATCVLHYGQGIFDGLKAFRGRDGHVRLFRLPDHARRLNRSAHYLCIPELDPAMVEESIRAAGGGGSALGAEEARHLAVYPADGDRHRDVPRRASVAFVSVLRDHRSGRRVLQRGDEPGAHPRLRPARAGGEGRAWRGQDDGNYAASLYGAEEAQKAGYTQVLWLDAVEHKYLDEVGTMNIMVKIGDEVVTPPLGGAILAGITRDSVLTLLREWGMRVSERQVSIDEVLDAAKAGRLEMWGTGTAAVISPVGELGLQGRAVCHQRRQDRCADAEAVRHHRRDPVRHRAGSARLGAAAGELRGSRDGRHTFRRRFPGRLSSHYHEDREALKAHKAFLCILQPRNVPLTAS